jgi:hypothetical protein
MKKTLRSLFLSFVATALFASAAFATCSGGTFFCGQSCNTSCQTSGGVTFSGMCVAGGGPTGCTGFGTSASTNQAAASYMRCGAGVVNGGGATVTCASGPFGVTGCSSDSQCATNQICVSTAGFAGCGTGSAVCMFSCSG